MTTPAPDRLVAGRPPVSVPPERQNSREGIRLSLGGGGILGIAHILAIEAIDDLGLQIAAISGTSIGAIIGAVRASGVPGRSIRAMALGLGGGRLPIALKIIAARAFDRRLFSPWRPDWAPLDGRSLLRHMLPPGLPADMENTAIPLVAVATDVETEMPHSFSSGNLVDILAACSATPGILRPVEIAGRTYIDGALLDPVPVHRPHEASGPVIAIDLTGEPEKNAPGKSDRHGPAARPAQMALRFIAATRLSQTQPDLLLRPAVRTWRMTEFHRAKEIFVALEPFKDDCKRSIAALMEERPAA